MKKSFDQVTNRFHNRNFHASHFFEKEPRNFMKRLLKRKFLSRQFFSYQKTYGAHKSLIEV